MRNLYDLTQKELEDYFLSINDKKFRAVQVYEFLYKKRVKSIDDMKNIGKNTIKNLKENFTMDRIKLLVKQEDKDVKKYLFELLDGNLIESVLMYHDYGISICVSSQVGCNMGCKFCESGRLKKVRNLEAYEILEQILMIEEDIKERISHVVVMGIGEPFDNYDNVMRFVKIINNPKGIDIGSRHITISSCGVVPGIEKFSNAEGQVNLAISLHAPNDEIRNKIMPISRAYSLTELMDALDYYYEKTNRRITFEYVLLHGINDSEKCALELSKLIKGKNAYVNLINYNETKNIDFKESDNILKFYDILKKNNIDVTIRRKFGNKISAACGQLRSKEV